MKKGIDLIREERKRQIEKLGHTPAKDDSYSFGELASAGSAYLKAALYGASIGEELWPWDKVTYKPKDPVTNLVKAGALLQAERERLQRATDFIAAMIDEHIETDNGPSQE